MKSGGTVMAWRIVAPEFVSSALDGRGAAYFGGRFNGVGRRVVYSSGSISLALLEMLAALEDRAVLRNHVCIPICMNANDIEIMARNALPAGWDSVPFSAASQRVGDAWVTEQRALVLRVPSVVVPQEHNYLVNPLHERFNEIEVLDPFPIDLDRRLVR